jgi:diguanylate cyclase (GGDEF)-like protein
MYREIARVLTNNIDEITRKWVEALRLSARTEVHKQLLSSEIVDGVKGMLANLAKTIEAGESSEEESLDLPAIKELAAAANPTETGPMQRTRATKPLIGPLAQAQTAAASLGKLRHKQHYDISEVVYEYMKLRQELWSALRTALPYELAWSPTVLSYIDRLLDELMLVTVDCFYGTSIRNLEKRAIADTTTQLYNKDYFRKRLNEELRRAVRYGQPISIVMIDMDNLKKINDTFGHPVGDEALKAIAAAILHTCRQTDVPCRYGGDEFVVILPETNKEQARAFANRVMAAVENLSILVVSAGQQDSHKGDVSPLTTGVLADEGIMGRSPVFAPSPTVSIGLASFPEDARNPETLLAKADDALYRAKNEGRNRVAE